MTRRLLLVHAHPDDETITTGGTIARCAAEGVEVTVLTCTLGEEGEVIGARWAGLVAGAADQLGGYRVGELTRALDVLGVGAGPRFLGGAGRWRDSGMAGTPAALHPRSFVSAAESAVLAALVSVLRQVRPQVVVTYDPAGGYGHPDHVRAHRATTAAIDAAGDPAAFPGTGPPWSVSKLYWTAVPRSALSPAGADTAAPPPGWRTPDDDELPAVDDERIDAVVDVSGVLAAKRAALRAHATQVTLSADGTCFALSNNIAQPVLAQEHYILARGEAGPRAADGREADLFAGVVDP